MVSATTADDRSLGIDPQSNTNSCPGKLTCHSILAVAADPVHGFAETPGGTPGARQQWAAEELVSVEYWRVQIRFIYPQVRFTAMCVLN